MARYRLLSIESDAKTSKGSPLGYLTGILYLAPAKEADGIHDLCPRSTPECRSSCLYGAGMAGVFPSIKRARIAKTLQYLGAPREFSLMLADDIRRLQSEAKKRGLTPAVRLNGTSDIPKLAQELALLFPEVQFYDYTKLDKPWQRTMSNYHITYSFDGKRYGKVLDAMTHGINVAVVFAGKELPPTWKGYRVIDGDKSDLRFLDPAGVIVGLRAKGLARKADVGGFIQIAGAA